MAWDITDTLVALLVGANFALCVYLVCLFRRVRVDLGSLQDAQPAGEELEATRALLEQVAVEIGRVADDLRADAEETEAREHALVERLDGLAERIRKLEGPPIQPTLPLCEPEKLPAAESETAPAPAESTAAEPNRDGPVPAAGRAAARASFHKRSDRARELHAQGKSVAEIAREMRLSGGAVELILGVGQQIEASGAGAD